MSNTAEAGQLLTAVSNRPSTSSRHPNSDTSLGNVVLALAMGNLDYCEHFVPGNTDCISLLRIEDNFIGDGCGDLRLENSTTSTPDAPFFQLYLPAHLNELTRGATKGCTTVIHLASGDVIAFADITTKIHLFNNPR